MKKLLIDECSFLSSCGEVTTSSESALFSSVAFCDAEVTFVLDLSLGTSVSTAVVFTGLALYS